jgi:hypothetical protein
MGNSKLKLRSFAGFSKKSGFFHDHIGVRLEIKIQLKLSLLTNYNIKFVEVVKMNILIQILISILI